MWLTISQSILDKLTAMKFGRWWWLTIPLGTVGWVLATIAIGAVTDFSHAMGAAAFGAANVIVGVLVYQAIAWLAHAIVQTLRSAPRS